MMITNVRGAFGSVKGKVEFDPANPNDASVEVVIDASTIRTLDEQRDLHLKSADFLDIAKYPTITFRSTKISLDGDGTAGVTGDLTIHGVTKPVTLKVEGPTAESKDPWGNVRVGASAATRINRSEFGLNWNAALESGGIMVADELTIELDVEMIRDPEPGT